MKLCVLSLVLLLISGSALSAHDLSEEYRFSAGLDPSYRLHWSFDLQAGTIAFAVNVSTTGWVGFGLSPNGQMPGSDVIIGWVESNGQVTFHDRYAIDRFLPPVDPSQDWFLVSGEEENGYTILEFTRNLTTCDVNDLNIEPDTARVIWSYHSSDPVSGSTIPRHEAQGAASLNLLGGLSVDRVEPDSADFVTNVKNVTIPDVDTTYWCEVDILPTEIQEQERYIYKISPSISEASSPYVHHIIIYLCTGLSHTFVGASGVCEDTHIDIQTCRQGGIIAAWAVGGDDFVFPPEVALPIGGPGARRIVVVEMHYDNPTLQRGVIDSSGIQFSYTNIPPQQRVGLVTISAPTTTQVIIPPGTPNFTVTAFCSRECTQARLPSDGITVFGSLLHTHLAGHGLVVEHFRETECGLREALEPIDENRRYDFNYQQFTILPKTRRVLPGDEIKVNCFYGTSGNTGVTLGGESTREEMCVSFLYYYPQTDFEFCLSSPVSESYQQFANQHIQSSLHDSFSQSVLTQDRSSVESILNSVEWTQDAIDSLQSIYLDGPQTSVCLGGSSRAIFLPDDGVPSADCPYVSPDTCTGKPGSQPGGCCRPRGSGAATLGHLSVLTTLLIFCLSIFLS